MGEYIWEVRYDVMLEPIDTRKDDGSIMDAEKEADLPDTVNGALCQKEEKQYDAKLPEKLPPERIHKYAFAFRCKRFSWTTPAELGGRHIWRAGRSAFPKKAGRKPPARRNGPDLAGPAFAPAPQDSSKSSGPRRRAA